ncbi:MAG: GerMN domain-containing protein [Microthrixaceae bacterium]|nr:GerMN domain-containing protein [Microthrixaceae bacterium]
MRRPTLRPLLAVAALVTIATACGVSPDDSPRAFPSDLTDPAPQVGDEPADGNKPASIYLVTSESQLVPVERDVRQVSVAGITRATLASPTSAEIEAGVTTSIPRNTTLLSGSVRNSGVIAIDLSEEFRQVDGAVKTTAIGQIVMGVGAQYDAERAFSFSIDGERITISTAEGSQNTVTPCDFVDALADPSKLEADVASEIDRQALVNQNALFSLRCGESTA